MAAGAGQGRGGRQRPGAAEAALLWRAQHRIDRSDAAGAEKLLGGLPPQRYPSQLAEL
ncbi:MAG: hypothetical protein JOZ15_08705, partial [Acidobacteria bacterium]|nr:hypothetical protein [Acidobacteriota bacterium]